MQKTCSKYRYCWQNARENFAAYSVKLVQDVVQWTFFLRQIGGNCYNKELYTTFVELTNVYDNVK